MNSGVEANAKRSSRKPEKDKEIDIEAYLKKVDPKLGKIISAVVSRVGVRRPKPTRVPPFAALTRAIIYQRNSDAAASAVFERLRGVAGADLRPRKVLALKAEKLHALGLSEAKASYVLNLADWFISHDRLAKELPRLSDSEIVRILTEIKGIGVWTANVYLIFTLGRLDVIPTADLGIRQAIQLAYDLKSPPSPAAVEELAEHWKPYRTIASIYLWHAGKLKLDVTDLR